VAISTHSCTDLPQKRIDDIFCSVDNATAESTLAAADENGAAAAAVAMALTVASCDCAADCSCGGCCCGVPITSKASEVAFNNSGADEAADGLKSLSS
jgi:hypothetical protein